MQPVGFTLRVLMLFSVFLLGLPNSAFDRCSREPAEGNGSASSSRSHALRTLQSVDSGLEEEMAKALGYPPSRRTAGLEEEMLLLPQTLEEEGDLHSRARSLDQEFGSWTPDRGEKLVAKVLIRLDLYLRGYADVDRDSGEFSRTLLHDPLKMPFLFELIQRLESEPKQTVSAMRKWLREALPRVSPETESVFQKFHRGEDSLESVETRRLLQAMELEPSEEKFLGGMLRRLGRQGSGERQQLVKALKEADAQLARISQWDFVHRFPGAYGMRLVRGLGTDSQERYIPGQSVTIPIGIYFTHIPSYAVLFTHIQVNPQRKRSGGSLVVADIPLNSIQGTSWVSYPKAGKIYEPEVKVAGKGIVHRVFPLDQWESFLEWVEFERRYKDSLKGLPGMDPRDVKRAEEWGAGPVWLSFLIERELRNRLRSLSKERRPPWAGARTHFQQAIRRALKVYPNYPTAIEKIREMIDQLPQEIQSASGAKAFLKSRFRVQLPLPHAAGLEEVEEYRPVQISEEPELEERLRFEGRLEEYRNRLVENAQGQRFLIKFRTMSHPAVEHLGHLWPDRNNPIREYVASQVGLALGANAAEIVIPPLAERERLAQRFSGVSSDGVYLTRLSYNVKPGDPALRQSDFKKAFTRALVAVAIFPRKYNFHRGNLGYSADRKTELFFDHDQAFNPFYADIESYTHAFIRSYFDSHYNLIHPNDLLNWIEPEGLGAAVQEIEEANLDALRDWVKRQLAQSAFGGSLPDGTHSEINVYFQHLKQWQGTLRKDVIRFFEMTFSYPRNRRFKEESLLTMDQIRAPLVSTAGLEEVEKLARDWVGVARRASGVASDRVKQAREAREAILALADRKMLKNLLQDAFRSDKLYPGQAWVLSRNFPGKGAGQELLRIHSNADTGEITIQVPGRKEVKLPFPKRGFLSLSKDLNKVQLVDEQTGADRIALYDYLEELEVSRDAIETENPSALLQKADSPPRLWHFPATSRNRLAGYSERMEDIFFDSIPFDLLREQAAGGELKVFSHVHSGDTALAPDDVIEMAENRLAVPWLLLKEGTFRGYLYVPLAEDRIQAASEHFLHLSAIQMLSGGSISYYAGLPEDQKLKILRSYFLVVPIDLGALASAQRLSLPGPAAGLEERKAEEVSIGSIVPPALPIPHSWGNMKSAAQILRRVVIGKSVARQFPQLGKMVQRDDHFLVDEGADIVVRLIELGTDSVRYYGGLEESQRFAAMAQEALISVEAKLPTAPEFLTQLREILTLAGIPEGVVAAGLEEFAVELDSLAVGA